MELAVVENKDRPVLEWAAGLRTPTAKEKKKGAKKLRLVVDEAAVTVSADDTVDMLKFKVRMALGVPPEASEMFLLSGSRHVAGKKRLKELGVRNGTKLTTVHFYGRPVGFQDVFRTRIGTRRVTVKALGDLGDGFSVDAAPLDTVLGLKLMMANATSLDHSNLELYCLPPINDGWSKAKILHNDLLLWDLTHADLYILHKVLPRTEPAQMSSSTLAPSSHRKFPTTSSTLPLVSRRPSASLGPPHLSSSGAADDQAIAVRRSTGSRVARRRRSL